MSKKVVIASACRTAVGSMGGQLSTVPAAEMGAVVIKEALKRAALLRSRLITYTWDVLSRLALVRT